MWETTVRTETEGRQKPCGDTRSLVDSHSDSTVEVVLSDTKYTDKHTHTTLRLFRDTLLNLQSPTGKLESAPS